MQTENNETTLDACCLNCGARLTGEYCNECGQKHIEGVITLGFLANWMIDAVTNADSRFFRTLKELITNPGDVARRYVHGCRRQYLNPARFFLVVVGTYLAFLALTGLLAPSVNNVASADAFFDETSLLFSIEFHRAWYDLYSNHRLFIYLGAIPLAAMAIRYSFHRSGYNYVGTLTLLLYVGAVYCFYGILLAGFYFAFSLEFFQSDRKLVEGVIGLIVYFQSIKAFYHLGWLQSVFATVWVFLLLILSAYLVTFACSWVVISFA